MSLEKQLHRESDKLFDAAYDKLFDQFDDGFKELTGISLMDDPWRTGDNLDEFRRINELRFISYGAPCVPREAARAAAREKYVEAFLRAQKQPLMDRFWAGVESLLRRG